MSNNVARVAFFVWLLGLVIVVAGFIFGGLEGAVIASFAYAPLFFIALIIAAAALRRTPRTLAIVTLVLAIITAPVSLAFVATAVTLVTN